MKITKEKAIKLAESGFWERMTAYQIANFQLNTKLLCMPFSVFHKAVEEALGRPVWTHEFGTIGTKGLLKELNGEKSKPSMEEIINLIPEEKRIIVKI